MDEDLQDILAKVAQEAVEAYIRELLSTKAEAKRTRFDSDPDFHERVKAATRQRNKNRYWSDPAYRESVKQAVSQRRENLKNDLDFQEQERARNRHRYHNNEAYRRRKLDRGVARKRERYATDPEFRERELERTRRWRERKKAEKEALKNDNDQ